MNANNDNTGRENCTPRHPEDENRDALGRWVKGNGAARGRATSGLARRMRAHREAMAHALNPEDAAILIRILAHRGAKGDTAAAKLVLSYLGGPPVASDFAEEVARLEELVDEMLADPAKMTDADRAEMVRDAVTELRRKTSASATRGGAADVHDAGEPEVDPEEGEA